MGDIHANSIEGGGSLFKRSIGGAFQKMSVEQMDRYLEELEWRFDNRTPRVVVINVSVSGVPAPVLQGWCRFFVIGFTVAAGGLASAAGDYRTSSRRPTPCGFHHSR